MKNEIRYRIDQIRRRNIPKEYKKTKLGILPADWDVHTLGDCLQRVERPVEVKPDELYTQIGIRSHGKGLFYKKPVTGTELGNKSVFWIVPDCFVLNIVFAWEQAIGKTTQSEAGMIGSHRFPMYLPINNTVNIDYLISYFLTKRGTDILEAASPGGAGRNKTLGQDRFLKSKIMLPPIAEQQKIAKILAAQDKIIELNEKLIAEKQQQKKYLMQQLLTGKKRLPLFDGEWEKVGFDEIFTFGSTNIFSREFMEKDFCGPKNIHYGDILVKYPEILDVSNSDIPALTPEAGNTVKEYVSNGDIVIADTAEDLTTGKVVEIQNIDKVQIVAGLHTMFCKPASGYFVPGWLGYFMNSEYYHNQLIPYIAGVKVMSISKGNILKTHLLVPSMQEQKMIVTILSTADQEISLLQQSLEQEKQKKKALMQLLLTGIVRVTI